MTALNTSITGPPDAVPAGGAVTADGQFFFAFRPIPDELLVPPGAVGDICRWINETATRPQPVLTLGNVLALWGAVVGQMVASVSDLRTNLYAVGVAESGAGKNHSRVMVKKLVEAAGLSQRLLGGEDLASDAAILKSLAARPSQLMQIDELGSLLSGWNNRNAASYQAGIPAMLMKIFSSANTLFLGREYATQDRADIHEPNLCIYGTSVPGRLYNSFRPEQVEDGLLGRVLVFETNNNDPEERQPAAAPVPVSIAQLMRRWTTREDLPPPPSLAYTPGNLEGPAQPLSSPLIVPMAAETQAVFDLFAASCREYRHRLRDNNGLDALWVRANEHAIKMALIIASGCAFDADALIITPEHARFATALVRLLVNNTCARVLRHVHENIYEKSLNAVLATIERAGRVGIDRSTLLRKHQSVKSQELTEIVDRLRSTGQVVFQETTPGAHGGRPGLAYFSRAASGGPAAAAPGV